jgi:hypothetical protein
MILAAAILIAALTAKPVGASAPVSLPAGTHIRFHLVRPLKSDRNKSGQRFSFVLIQPVEVAGRVVVADGTVGFGTVVLAGHNGTSGHEGDLTLRLDGVPAVNGAQVMFCQQRLRINGRNRKVMAGVLGFIPFAGIGARLIRGSEIRISTKTPIETVLSEPTASPPNFCPVAIG